MDDKCGALIIGYDFRQGSLPTMTIGTQTNEKLDIINIIQGLEARELYNKLTDGGDFNNDI